MSIIKNAKEFFGLTPADMERDEAYYGDDLRYETEGSAAYQPRADYDDYGYDQPRYERDSYASRTGFAERPVERPRSYEPAIVPVDLITYKQAMRVGEPFRDGDAVVFDISRMDAAEAKRVVDFAAGVCFALRGSMEKLGGRIFALVPEGAAVTKLDLERAAGLR